jgi:hypothetical protein
MTDPHPYATVNHRTALGAALAKHILRFRTDRHYRLGEPEIGTLDTIWSRRARNPQIVLECRAMSLMLANPCRNRRSRFRARFIAAYSRAFFLACPLWSRLIREFHKLSGTSWDYTLPLFDPHIVHALEEEAPSDPVIATFVRDIARRLDASGAYVDTKAYRQAFDTYSEALVYRMLKAAGAGTIRVDRMPETDDSTPDFECTLLCLDPPRTFYIEVKTPDILHADQRHAELLDEGMLAQDALDKQVAAGKQVAIGMREVAPYRKYLKNREYDWRSVRMTIDRLIEKSRQAFKPSQFQLGPTFALVSLLRLSLHDHGDRPLAPFAYSPYGGGACVSGALWNVCFGHAGDPIHRSPEFEGAGTVDGRLAREGVLVGYERLPGPGVLFLRNERDGYRLDGLYDEYWVSGDGWSNIQTEEVLFALCRRFNNSKNTNAHILTMP